MRLTTRCIDVNFCASLCAQKQVLVLFLSSVTTLLLKALQDKQEHPGGTLAYAACKWPQRIDISVCAMISQSGYAGNRKFEWYEALLPSSSKTPTNFNSTGISLLLSVLRQDFFPDRLLTGN